MTTTPTPATDQLRDHMRTEHRLTTVGGERPSLEELEKIHTFLHSDDPAAVHARDTWWRWTPHSH